MPSTIFKEDRPLTEAEFLAIGETPERIELFDGGLLVTPSPSPLHQRISTRLAILLTPVAEQVGLLLHEAVNVRLQPNRVPIPDLVITTQIDYAELIIDSSTVLLVCEILSPSNPDNDRVIKMSYYAMAGIPWYLLVNPVTGELLLYKISDGKYELHASAEPGVPLRLTDPVTVTIDPAELLPPP
ncbi:Uma2 family endonuclease [Actinoplanes regularis]|uniref:Uma2 family endonuclease n=1 Tax=Actinoplanes regularis TaxID=52697 RepID=UPI002557A4C6|nr:Uma2 family endonuclease [Actinoplanes regularis]